MDDAQKIAAAYNLYVKKGGYTLDQIPQDATHFATEIGRDDCAYFVAENEEGNFSGWGRLIPWSPKDGYRHAAETSIYVTPDMLGLGFGAAIKRALIAEARARGIRHLVARVIAGNESSIKMNCDFGYEIVGVQHSIGDIDGTPVNVIVMQRLLDYNRREVSDSRNFFHLDWRGRNVFAWRMDPPASRRKRPIVLMLHGAGTADSDRTVPLARHFEAIGHSVIGFDFIGHGKSDGSMQDSSLADRLALASEIVSRYTDGEDLIVCGFSMSGDTALRLVDIYPHQIVTLGLFCPAVYSDEAVPIPFGPEFSNVIRRNDSWTDSSAFDLASRFSGRAAVIIGQNDHVIPWEVVLRLVSELKKNTVGCELNILPDAEHQVAKWLSLHPVEAQRIAMRLSETNSGNS